MTKAVVFDTNVIIKFINKRPGFIDIEAQFAEDIWYVSVVTRIELYGFAGITAKEKADITRFLKRVIVIPITVEIEQLRLNSRPSKSAAGSASRPRTPL
ncbi:hypothetical protein FACS1894200_09920 [Spirochaetia bacterium]|nr:hypothetical protein FACS1894200_09920 [Spirochaetia bacterium]